MPRTKKSVQKLDPPSVQVLPPLNTDVSDQIIPKSLQIVEDMHKVTALIEILVTIVTLVTMTYVSVRLGHLMSSALLVFLVSVGVFMLLFAKTALSKTGGAFKNAKLLGSFKNPNNLLGMRRDVKKSYVKNIGRLSVMRIPIGVGDIVFTTANGSLNSRLSSLFVELCVNALIFF
ncbi:hypothetical protein Fcan01_15403 [Folsomia candida]|uniref:Uncharacterized protein n=1 Tax=Folsomia candida TaxID=158441 RepID=A0A226DW42_FOLCA|nr:hypothetical protein Fcan01_15403 [Folsomia candida]